MIVIENLLPEISHVEHENDIFGWEDEGKFDCN